MQIAMQVEKINSIKVLVIKLKENPVLRYCCGFDVLGKAPSESTFSRFIEKLSNSEHLKQIFHVLVIKAKELDIIDGEHVSIDSDARCDARGTGVFASKYYINEDKTY